EIPAPENMTRISSACGPLLARLRLANFPRSFRYSGQYHRSAEHYDANLHRSVRPQRDTNIVLTALVDVTPAPSSTTRTGVGDSDRRTQAPPSPRQSSEHTRKGFWFPRDD